jgi:hypothetical protein
LNKVQTNIFLSIYVIKTNFIHNLYSVYFVSQEVYCIYIHSIPPDVGLRICPKHVGVDWRSKPRIYSAPIWFLLHRYNEMHGQQNVKYFHQVWINYLSPQTGLFFSSRKCHGNIGTCMGLIFSLKILSVISKIWKSRGSGYNYWQLANTDYSFMNSRKIKWHILRLCVSLLNPLKHGLHLHVTSNFNPCYRVNINYILGANTSSLWHSIFYFESG